MKVAIEMGLTDERERVWFAFLDDVEVASGRQEGRHITWHADEDVPPGFEGLLHAECERLHRHGYVSTAELDRDIAEGRVRALGN